MTRLQVGIESKNILKTRMRCYSDMSVRQDVHKSWMNYELPKVCKK